MRFQDARCSDARDRIYGTMSFIDWQGKPPPRVDYSLSKAELAVRLMAYHDVDLSASCFAQVLVETLDFGVNDLEQLNQTVFSDEMQRILNATFDINVPDGIPLASDAVEDFAMRTRDPEWQENIIDSQCYSVVLECRSRSLSSQRLEACKQLDRLGQLTSSGPLRRSRINLYEDVGTRKCKSCNHCGFISKPRDVAHHYVRPGDILFSGLNGPDSHIPAISMVLKTRMLLWT